MLSHLSAIYIHNQLPRLSALCAATTAAMGAAAGMAWLVDGRYETISMAISSMIGDVSGMICDGASNSCAMKVSTSASAAWKAVLMALDDTAVTGNEGIVAHDVEAVDCQPVCVSKPFDATNGSADYRDYGEQGQINARFWVSCRMRCWRTLSGLRGAQLVDVVVFVPDAGCDAGASYPAYGLFNSLMLLDFVGRIRRFRRIRQPIFTR